MAMDPTKVQVMLEWPRPRTLTELRGFLELTRYIGSLCKDMGKLLGLLPSSLRRTAIGGMRKLSRHFTS